MYELTDEDDVLLRFKGNESVKPTRDGGFQGFFSIIASKGLITSQAVEILQRIFKQVSSEPQFARSGNTGGSLDGESPPAAAVDQAYNEMSRVLRITDEVRPKSLHHRLLLALLIYIFNFHNQPQVLPSAKTASLSSQNRVRHPYLEILSKVALELSQPSNPSNSSRVTEREVTLWTMVAIGSASSFSPWRLDIPFMGHLIEWMENNEDRVLSGEGAPAVAEGTSSSYNISSKTSTMDTSDHYKSLPTNLEKLTACLRGYYLYGADKKTLRSLQKWKDSEPHDPVGVRWYFSSEYQCLQRSTMQDQAEELRRSISESKDFESQDLSSRPEFNPSGNSPSTKSAIWGHTRLKPGIPCEAAN